MFYQKADKAFGRENTDCKVTNLEIMEEPGDYKQVASTW